MRARKPAVPVEFVVIKTKLADELRMLGTAAFQPRANIQNYQAVMPVSEISQPVFDVEIVQVAANHFFALLGANRGSGWILSLPARDFFWIFHVGKIDHAHRSGRVVGQVNVVAVDKGAVHAAGNRRGVFRNQFRMRRVGSVIERNAVLAIRCAFARDDQNLARPRSS